MIRTFTLADLSKLENSALFPLNNIRGKEVLLKELYNILPEELHHRRIDELHVFANDPKFSNLIVEHFGFSYCLGRSLVWRFQGR